MNLYRVTTNGGDQFYVLAANAADAERYVLDALPVEEGRERSRKPKNIDILAYQRKPDNNEALLLPPPPPKELAAKAGPDAPHERPQLPDRLP